MLRPALVLVSVAALGLGAWWMAQLPPDEQFSAEEKVLVRSLWIGNLEALARDPSNRVADDDEAAQLGRRLFFDTRLSANGGVSCATCHKPERYFTDGLPTGQGLRTGQRNTMGLVGAARSPWQFWDGRKDSQWSQALSPLESTVEHGANRMELVRLLSEDTAYRTAYQAVFGELPPVGDPERFPPQASPLGNEEQRTAWEGMSTADQHAVNQAFANLGKALAAYQRKLEPGPAPFDEFAGAMLAGEDARALLSGAAQAGLKLFIGKASCVNCHNGPLLSNNEFHNTGVLPAVGQLPGLGRAQGVREAIEDPFNCLGAYSDDHNGCAELRYAKSGDDVIGAWRAPSLRNVTETAPYMHAGQITTLREVLEHYNRADLALVGHNEAKPLSLTRAELRMLEAFLNTLTGPLSADARWLTPPN